MLSGKFTVSQALVGLFVLGAACSPANEPTATQLVKGSANDFMNIMDLTITKSGKATASVNEEVVYTVQGFDNSPGYANNVIVVDTLPDNATFVSATGGGSLDAAGKVYTWPSAGLLMPSQATPVYTITLKYAATGSYTNNAHIHTDNTETNLNNNHADATTVVATVPDKADVTVSKDGKATAIIGEWVTYTIIGHNNGPVAAATVVITDSIPVGATVQTTTPAAIVTGRLVTWPSYGTLAPGANTTPYTIQLSYAALGMYTDSARVKTTTIETNYDNNTDDAMTIVTDPPCQQCDGGLTKLTLTNTGPSGTLIVKDSKGKELFHAAVLSGANFSFIGIQAGGAIGPTITIEYGPNPPGTPPPPPGTKIPPKVTIKTDCSDGNVAPGGDLGNFEVVQALNLAKQPICPSNICSLGYPFTDVNYPRTKVVFNESEVLQAFGSSSSTIMIWAADEHAPILGVANNGFNVSAMPVKTSAQHISSPIAVGDTTVHDDSDRPFYPAIFLTDLTQNGMTSRAGDWQYGGTPIRPNDVFGTWKGAAVGGGTNGIVSDADPTKNNWSLAGGDTPAGGFGSLVNQGYGTELRWNIGLLPMQSGHLYRVQVMVHDGDQNKAGGDVGQACVLVKAP